MKNVLERLERFIKLSGKSINKLTEMADLSQNTVYNWFSNKGTKPTISALLAVCDALDIDIRDLFTDEAENTELSPKEVKLLNAYKGLSDRHKEAVLDVAVGLSQLDKK